MGRRALLVKVKAAPYQPMSAIVSKVSVIRGRAVAMMEMSRVIIMTVRIRAVMRR